MCPCLVVVTYTGKILCTLGQTNGLVARLLQFFFIVSFCQFHVFQYFWLIVQLQVDGRYPIEKLLVFF